MPDLSFLSLAVDRFDIGTAYAKLSLSARKRARLYRKLASLVRTGMPLPRALDAIWRLAAEGGERPRVAAARVVDAWRSKVYDGRSFGEALAGWVPAREWMIVEAGSSDLAEALEDAATLIEASRQMTAAASNAVGYPLFLSTLLGVLLWIFSNDAIPAFAEVKPMESWTGLAASMATLSTLVRLGLVPLVGFAGLALLAVLWSLPRWTGEWRARFDAIPPWSIYRIVLGAGFLTSLVAFLRAGMPVPEALRRLRGTANPWLGERIDAALYFLNSGHDLGEALHRAKHDFPAREIVEDLRVYATLGNLDQAMQRLVGEWVKLGIDGMRAAGDSMKVAGMILIAATIAWIQLGIIAVQQQLTTGY